MFLDDIADLDLPTQARLFGALDSGSFHRVGGGDLVQVNERSIAGTRHSLEQRVREGRFRSDLYYHLNVVPVEVPPLRENGEDIPELLSFYVDYFVTNDKLAYRSFAVAAWRSRTATASGARPASRYSSAARACAGKRSCDRCG